MAAASHAWALPPDAPKPDAQAASLIRVLYPSYDADLRLVTTPEAPARELKIFEAIAKRWNQRTWLLALLLTPQHEQHHKYGVNGNFSLQVALIEPAGAGRLVAASGFVPLHWGADPHWAQRLERIDTAPYTFAKNDRGFGLRVHTFELVRLDALEGPLHRGWLRRGGGTAPASDRGDHPHEPDPSRHALTAHGVSFPSADALREILPKGYALPSM